MKWKCRRCSWRSEKPSFLYAPNPFDPDDEIAGCPQCKMVDCFECVCDVPDCWELQSCGFPTPTGYRQTCGKHFIEMNPKPKK